jgi:hypothetical protein
MMPFYLYKVAENIPLQTMWTNSTLIDEQDFGDMLFLALSKFILLGVYKRLESSINQFFMEQLGWKT